MRRKKLGEYIRFQRKIRHMSLQQLAMMCNVSVTHISRLERGLETIYIDLELLYRIAISFHIPLEKMLEESGYIEQDKVDRALYQEVETFLGQPYIRNYYDIQIEALDIKQKKEVYDQLLRTLHNISYTYRK